LLKKATLRGKEWEFEFARPFDVLFSIGKLYFKKRRWGRTLHKYISAIRHVDLGPRLDRLDELSQIYSVPQACSA
jgi:hypothetical protein